MKRLHFPRIMMLGLLLFLGASVNGQQNGVKFEKGSFEQALTKAKSLKKPLFVHVYASWVEACKGMEEWIFPDDKVGALYNERFVNWVFVTDSVEDYSHLGKVRILALPEFLFYNSSGELVYRESGFKDAPETIEMAQRALNPANHLSALQKKYDAGDRTPGFMVNYIMQMDGAGKDMEKVGMDYLQKVQDYEVGEENNFKIIYICLYDMQSRIFKAVLNQRVALSKEFGDQQVMDIILRCYRRTMELAVARKDDQLFQTLKPVVDKVSASPAEAKRTWQMEQMNYNSSIGRWPDYFKAAQVLFALPGTNEPELLNNAAMEAALHGAGKADWEQALEWVDRSLGMNREYYNLHTKAELLFLLGQKDQARELANESLQKAKAAGAKTTEIEAFLKKLG